MDSSGKHVRVAGAGGAWPAPALLLARACLAVVFIVAGYGKIFTGDAFGRLMAAKGLPAAPFIPGLAILIELGGGLVLLSGARTRLMAILFAVYTMVASLISHAFWLQTDAAARAANLVQFDKNLAIIGGFILLAMVGGGKYSVDGWWNGRPRQVQPK